MWLQDPMTATARAKCQPHKRCIKGESNPRRVDGNDPGYHYPINAAKHLVFACYTICLNGPSNVCGPATLSYQDFLWKACAHHPAIMYLSPVKPIAKGEEDGVT